MAEGRGLSPAVKAGVVHGQQAAPGGHGDTGAEEMEALAHPVGQVGDGRAQGQGLGHVPGRDGQDQVGFDLHHGGSPLFR